MTLGRYRRGLPTCALLAATLVAMASSAWAQDAPVQEKAWKLSTAVGPAFALGIAGERWAKLIAERAGGKLAVKVFPGAVLAKRDPAREFLALRDGAAELSVGSSLYWAAQVAELNVIGLPWIVGDAKALDALVVGPVKAQLDAAIDRAGAVALAYAPLGLRALATTSVAVQAPDDLAGLKVRTAWTPLLTDVFMTLSAEPRTLSFADAQAAFTAGTLNAQEGTPATFAAARLDALGVRHVVLWGAIAEIAVFAVNRAAWTSLTDGERAIVGDAAREIARELPELARAENDAAIAELVKRGVTVTRLTATGRAAFAFAARAAYDRWAGAAGADLVGAAEAASKSRTP